MHGRVVHENFQSGLPQLIIFQAHPGLHGLGTANVITGKHTGAVETETLIILQESGIGVQERFRVHPCQTYRNFPEGFELRQRDDFEGQGLLETGFAVILHINVGRRQTVRSVIAAEDINIFELEFCIDRQTEPAVFDSADGDFFRFEIVNGQGFRQFQDDLGFPDFSGFRPIIGDLDLLRSRHAFDDGQFRHARTCGQAVVRDTDPFALIGTVESGIFFLRGNDRHFIAEEMHIEREFHNDIPGIRIDRQPEGLADTFAEGTVLRIVIGRDKVALCGFSGSQLVHFRCGKESFAVFGDQHLEFLRPAEMGDCAAQGTQGDVIHGGNFPQIDPHEHFAEILVSAAEKADSFAVEPDLVVIVAGKRTVGEVKFVIACFPFPVFRQRISGTGNEFYPFSQGQILPVQGQIKPHPAVVPHRRRGGRKKFFRDFVGGFQFDRKRHGEITLHTVKVRSRDQPDFGRSRIQGISIISDFHAGGITLFFHVVNHLDGRFLA